MPVDPVHLIPPEPPKRAARKWHQTWWAPWLVFLFGAAFLIVGAIESAGDPSTAKQYLVIVGLIVAIWYVIDLAIGFLQGGLTELVIRLRYPLVAALYDNTRSTRMGVALLALVIVAVMCGMYLGLTSFGRPQP